MKFVEAEDDKTTWLRLSGKGRNWLTAGFEEQYARIYASITRSTARKKLTDFDYDYHEDRYSFGDSKFLGIPVSVGPLKAGTPQYYSYYDDIKPEQRDALRAALYKAFQALPVGEFHRWDSVLDHSAFGEHNPLTRGQDPSKLLITIDRRHVPRLPEHVEQAGKFVLDVLLRLRLLPLDAVRAAIDGEGKLCIARLSRLDGYFGRPYQADEDHSLAATRVIVQPDFSVLVIGLDPSPAAEIAPFCERAGGQAGQGALTFKITRESVIRAASQGLSASAIVARLRKHASVDVPENVLREVEEWAGWVRLVNVRGRHGRPLPRRGDRRQGRLGARQEGRAAGRDPGRAPRPEAVDRRSPEAPGARHPGHQGRHHPRRVAPSPASPPRSPPPTPPRSGAAPGKRAEAGLRAGNSRRVA